MAWSKILSTLWLKFYLKILWGVSVQAFKFSIIPATCPNQSKIVWLNPCHRGEAKWEIRLCSRSYTNVWEMLWSGSPFHPWPICFSGSWMAAVHTLRQAHLLGKIAVFLEDCHKKANSQMQVLSSCALQSYSHHCFDPICSHKATPASRCMPVSKCKMNSNIAPFSA